MYASHQKEEKELVTDISLLFSLVLFCIQY